MVEAAKDLSSLDVKVNIAKIVVKDSLMRFKKPAVVWSAGKDSTTVLNIVRDVGKEMGVSTPPCLFIEHGDHFEETHEMIRQLTEAWGLKMIYASNSDVISHRRDDGTVFLSELNDRNRSEARKIGFEGEKFEYGMNSAIGNHLLKTVPFNETITKYQLDALFTGIRWDENPARVGDVFTSRRANPPHFRVQAILPFTERDIWDYITREKLPFHPLYKQGYRSIDGKADSSKSSDKPAWEQDIQHTSERAGRAQNKEEMMDKLRQLGYM